jgi:hypothetical protein
MLVIHLHSSIYYQKAKKNAIKFKVLNLLTTKKLIIMKYCTR